MKNRLAFTTLIMVFAVLCSNNLMAQKFSGLDKSPADIASFPTSYRVSDKAVKIVYSRPQLKGRTLGTDLAEYGKVWRTGANEAAEITFYKNVNFGDGAVKAGTYSLFTIPGKNEWTIILNKKLNQWGSYSYDKSADAARVVVKTSKGSESLEAFSIAFKEVEDGVHMVLGWDKVRAAVPLTF